MLIIIIVCAVLYLLAAGAATRLFESRTSDLPDAVIGGFTWPISVPVFLGFVGTHRIIETVEGWAGRRAERRAQRDIPQARTVRR